MIVLFRTIIFLLAGCNMQMPFEHYAAGESLYNRIVAPVCERYGLTYMEFTVLMFLANNPQYDTAAEIVKYRRIAKSHVSISVQSLQRRGLLEGGHANGDRRAIHLKLLSSSDPIILDGRAAQRRFAEILFDGFSPQEQENLNAFMHRIDLNIARHHSDSIQKTGE